MSGAHALLAPSAAKRWLTCTPSARLSEKYENVESEAAAEGTLAHSLGEVRLKDELLLEHSVVTLFNTDQIEANPLYKPEMRDYIEGYVKYCLADHQPGDVILIEKRYDMTSHVPEGFGTGDFMLYRPSTRKLYFKDLKYGKGVPVYAQDNPQLKIYALGFENTYGWQYEVESISLEIYQPRINNNSTWEISYTDLMTWADDYLRPRAQMAWIGSGEFVAGDHCQFCPARFTCKARADHYRKATAFAFGDVRELRDDEILALYEQLQGWEDWVKDLKHHVLSEAVKGKKWPGYKIVAGRSQRVIKDKHDVESALILAGHTDIYTDRELLGITELKERIGSKAFKEIVEPGLLKPTGAPTFVPVTDKRSEYSKAAAVFHNAANERELLKDE